MTIPEMLAHCEAQMALEGEKAKISLVMPGRFGKGTKTLCAGGPSGRIVSERADGTVLVFFPALVVKSFLLAIPPACQS